MSLYSLNASTGTPIYRQLVEQTGQLVASGRLTPGERLPSVRAMAAELGVNPMTVSKAYSLLEQAAVVTRRRGVGMVVTRTTVEPVDALSPQVDALVEVAHRLRLSQEEVAQAIQRAWPKPEEET